MKIYIFFKFLDNVFDSKKTSQKIVKIKITKHYHYRIITEFGPKYFLIGLLSSNEKINLDFS